MHCDSHDVGPGDFITLPMFIDVASAGNPFESKVRSLEAMVMSLLVLFSFTRAAAIMHILCQANSLQTRADLVGIVSAMAKDVRWMSSLV